MPNRQGNDFPPVLNSQIPAANAPHTRRVAPQLLFVTENRFVTSRTNLFGFARWSLETPLRRQASGDCPGTKKFAALTFRSGIDTHARCEYVYRHRFSMSIHFWVRKKSFSHHQKTHVRQLVLMLYFPDPAGPGASAGTV